MEAGAEFLGWMGIFAAVFVTWVTYELRQLIKRRGAREVLRAPHLSTIVRTRTNYSWTVNGVRVR